MPVCSVTRSPPMRGAGARCSSARRDTGSMWFDSTIASGYTRRSCGTPARSAASVEQSTNAAAWSTFHCEQCHFVYGAANIGFLADGCSRNSGVTGSRRQASGFAAATRLNPAHSSAVARAFSATVSPDAARRAVSNAEYISGALMKPAARSGAGMISSAGRMLSSGPTSSPCTVSTGAVPVMCPRRSRNLASPPTTSATSRSPRAMARNARVNGVDCSTPSSAITERAWAPTRSATMRPGSG